MPGILITKRRAPARDDWLEREGVLITSDYIIDETLTLLRFRSGCVSAEEWWHAIAGSKRVVRELSMRNAQSAPGTFSFVTRTRIFHSQIAQALR